MALKLVITKEAFDALPDATKAEYKVDPANADAYKLDVEGLDDPAELRRARDREKQEAADAKKEAKRLQTELDEEKRKQSRATGDIDTLEKSWQSKMDTAVNDREAKIKKKDEVIRNTFVIAKVQEIAARISTSPELIFPHIKARLSVDTESDEPITRVLDAQGKPSALSVAELEKEFVDNKAFAPIIKASSASGGGATGNHGGGGASQKKPEEMSDKDRTELFNKDPAKFAKLFPAATT